MRSQICSAWSQHGIGLQYLQQASDRRLYIHLQIRHVGPLIVVAGARNCYQRLILLRQLQLIIRQIKFLQIHRPPIDLQCDIRLTELTAAKICRQIRDLRIQIERELLSRLLREQLHF